MKHLKLFFALFAMLALGVGNTWAVETTVSWTVSKDALGSGIGSGTITTGTYTWSYTRTLISGSSYTGTSLNNGYLQIGKNEGVENLEFTTSAIPGTIKSVAVDCASYSNKHNISITVGGTTYLEKTATPKWSNNAGGTKTGTGESSGEIVISFTDGSRALYIKSITVVYEETSGSGSTEPVLSVTPTEVDFGTVYQGATVEAKTVAVNFSNLTGAVTYNGLEATPFTATGSISATGDKITIAADASTIDEYSQTLTVVSAADNKTAEVTVTMKVVEAPAPTGTFELYSGELTEGDYVIYYNGSAMKAEVASSRLSYVEVAPADNKIENPDAATIWHIAQSGTNWTIYNNDKGYAAGTGTANKAQLLSQEDITTSASASDNLKKASWTVTGTETYDFVNVFNSTKDSPVNATLRNNVNGGTNYGFACYATNTGGALTLYKKSDGKQPAGLVYETNKYRTKLGDSFVTPTLTNPNSLNVTYSSSNNDVAEVATDGSVTIKAVGGVEITATFAGSETHRQGSAKYTICVTEHAGTQADPYSVADARRVIDVMETAEGVYATGIVSEIVTAYNSTYGNISYNISADGLTTSNQLQAYRGKSYDGANFTSANDVKVGDEVVIKGTLKKYSATYEFDENNELVSLNRTKEQAGLAYAETEHTANVGEDFVEPALTNPNNLTVTYSSSNTTLATVNATTGEVTILAAGKVTITASTTGNASYAAGSASYNITITDPSLAIATLPFYFDGKRADIENTAGMTHEGIDSDYSAKPYLKFNTAGDWAIVQFDSEPGEFSFLLKQYGSNAGTFTVYESANGEDYTSIWSGGDLGGDKESATIEPTLSPTARYVKFEYTTKGPSTNYGLGSISIQKADHRQEAGLAWNPATVSLTIGDAFTAPTLSNPNGLTGITFASDNEALATVTNAGAISLVSGKTGTATITATYAGDENYKTTEVTCVINVNPVTDEVVILAQHAGKWYAMMAQCPTGLTERLAALPVEYINGTLYNVKEENKALITWTRAFVDDKVTFQNNGKYLKGKSKTTLILEEGETGLYLWDKDTYTMTIEGTVRTFLYHKSNDCFRNYDAGQASNGIAEDKEYSSLPVVTDPVYATGDAYGRTVTTGNFGTICIPYGSSNYTGAEFYEVAWVKMNEESVPTTLYLDQLEAGATLEAGKPYIFKATATEIAIIGDGTSVATPITGKNGLTGTFVNITAGGILVDNYIIAQNQFWTATAENYLNAYRAYIVPSSIPTTEPAEIPGRRRIAMGAAGENEATGLDNITTTNAPVKVLVNGQLIIIREGVKYNVQGQKL